MVRSLCADGCSVLAHNTLARPLTRAQWALVQPTERHPRDRARPGHSTHAAIL